MSQRMRLTPLAGSGLKDTSRCRLHASYVLMHRVVVFRPDQHQARVDGQAFPLFDQTPPRPDSECECEASVAARSQI
jgi:hypothetical protein